MRVTTFFCIGLLAAFTATAEPPGSPDISSPSISLPGADPADVSGEPESPDIPQPAGAPGQGTGPVVVQMRDIPIDDSSAPGVPFHHLQGDFMAEEGGGNPVPGDSQGIGSVNPGPPPGEPPESTLAVGDAVYSFNGMGATGWIPPDTILAVGQNHIIEATNSHFTIYSKLGDVKRPQTTFASFFGGLTPTGWQGYMFDPKVIYNVATDQFVMIALGVDDINQTSFCFFGISQSGDPLGGWWFYQIPNTWAVPADADAWWDFASVGADSWGLYFTGNLYYWVGGFKHSMVLAVNPAVFSGGANNGWKWSNVQWPTGGSIFSPQVVQPQSIDPGQATFFVNSLNPLGSKVALWKMTGDRASTTTAPVLAGVEIGTSPYWGVGETIDQPGTAADLHGGDSRVLNAVYSQSRVYFTLTSDPLANFAQSGMFVGKLNTTTNVNEWDTTYYSPPGVFYFYPAIGIAGGLSTLPNISLYFSWTQPAVNQFASGGVKVYTNHPSSTAGPIHNVISGLGPYEVRDNLGRNRWGDYSGGVYDFFCGHFWGATEYAATSNSWRTRIASHIASGEVPCRLLDVTYPDGNQSFSAGDNVTMTWGSGNLPPTDDLYVFLLDGANFDQLGGPLAISSTSFNFQMPNINTSLGKMYVGSWNGSAYSTFDWSDEQFSVTGFPELVASQLTPPSSAFPGQPVTITNEVENTGPLGAGSFQIELRYSNNTSCTVVDDLIATRTVSGLAAGSTDSASTQATIPVSASLGSGYICMFIDTQGSVAEFDENNNISIALFTVTQPSQQIFTDGFESGGTTAWSSTVP